MRIWHLFMRWLFNASQEDKMYDYAVSEELRDSCEDYDVDLDGYPL